MKKNPRFIIKSGFKSRAGYNGACTVYLYKKIEIAGTQMPTSVVDKYHCKTHAPGWLNGAHPSVGETVTRTVCFHWLEDPCNWSTSVEIKNCDGYFLFNFADTPVCWLRYCGA